MRTRVYPRACGGTGKRHRCFGAQAAGSIPAHAGEPRPMPMKPGVSGTMGLSPRMRGNRESGINCCGLVQGLSPRMRGNLPAAIRLGAIFKPGVYPRACGGTSCWRGLPRGRRVGSIPAHAGEPLEVIGSFRAGTPIRVYPRACGGTYRPLCSDEPSGVGLSPRMRGNLPR